MNFPHASRAFKKLNPHYFGVGAFQPKIAQSKAEPTLDGKPPGRQTRGPGLAGSTVKTRVSLTNLRRRLLDSDNLIGGLKPLRDSIARSMMLDDADTVIDWEYGQQVTQGPEGTIVKIDY